MTEAIPSHLASGTPSPCFDIGYKASHHKRHYSLPTVSSWARSASTCLRWEGLHIGLCSYLKFCDLRLCTSFSKCISKDSPSQHLLLWGQENNSPYKWRTISLKGPVLHTLPHPTGTLSVEVLKGKLFKCNYFLNWDWKYEIGSIMKSRIVYGFSWITTHSWPLRNKQYLLLSIRKLQAETQLQGKIKVGS